MVWCFVFGGFSVGELFVLVDFFVVWSVVGGGLVFVDLLIGMIVYMVSLLGNCLDDLFDFIEGFVIELFVFEVGVLVMLVLLLGGVDDFMVVGIDEFVVWLLDVCVWCVLGDYFVVLYIFEFCDVVCGFFVD